MKSVPKVIVAIMGQVAVGTATASLLAGATLFLYQWTGSHIISGSQRTIGIASTVIACFSAGSFVLGLLILLFDRRRGTFVLAIASAALLAFLFTPVFAE